MVEVTSVGFEVFSHLLPEVILLVGGCAVLFTGVTAAARSASVTPMMALMVIAAALVATLRSDGDVTVLAAPGVLLTPLSHYVRLATLSIGLLLVLVNWNQPAARERGEYMSMILFSLLGVLLTSSANDWVLLFFAIELVSVPTYVLVGISRTSPRASESAVKYFFLGAFSAAVLAYGLSFLYGASGTTTIFSVDGGVVSSNLIAAGSSAYLMIGLLFVVAGLAFKIAAVPFHGYAPDVYEGAASPITGMLGFVPKLAGFVALIKLFGALDWALPSSLNWLMWVMAAATMTVGNVLALLQTNVKRMLAYSSIAHTGYMLVALLAGPVAGTGPMKDGVAALLFYMTVYGVMNLGAFALLSAYRVNDEPAETLDDISGLATRAPWLAFGLVVCVFGLMGFPPTAGFLGKLYIFSSALSLPAAHPFHGPMLALVIIGVLNSAIAAAYYLRIAGAVYMGSPIGEGRRSPGVAARWGLGACSIAVIALFIVPSTLTNPAGQVRVTASTMTAPRSQFTVDAAQNSVSDTVASSPVRRRP